MVSLILYNMSNNTILWSNEVIHIVKDNETNNVYASDDYFKIRYIIKPRDLVMVNDSYGLGLSNTEFHNILNQVF